MNTSKLDSGFNDLQLEADALTSIAFALQEAYERGNRDAETYNPGFWMLANLMKDHADNIASVHILMDETEGCTV